MGRRLGSDPTLLWLWRRLETTALIGPLAWEPPRAAGAGAALKSKKKKRKKEIKIELPYDLAVPFLDLHPEELKAAS